MGGACGEGEVEGGGVVLRVGWGCFFLGGGMGGRAGTKKNNGG